MITPVLGIHHITAIASDPKKTVEFYTHILGLRLVKKSVNQDDVETYHLFFGDITGEPGMDLTFFTFQPTFPGNQGLGQVTTISLAVPEASLQFWKNRLEKYQLDVKEVLTPWGVSSLTFLDFDGQQFELVGVSEKDLNAQKSQPWTTDDITAAQAIRSFDSARLTVMHLEQIEPILVTALGYTLIDHKGSLYLYGLPNAGRAAYLEVEVAHQAEHGSTGAGTVHHIAFRVKDEDHQAQTRQAISALGLQPTPVIDRFYFKSVYFRTPAGILFELATDGPGFTADETEDELGKKLALPPFLEHRRAEIEAGLPPLE